MPPPAPALETTGLDHVVLYCRDPAVSRDFYTGILGMTVRHESESYVFLSCGAQVVALFRSRDGAPMAGKDMDHVAFTVGNAYDEALERLEGLGIKVETRAHDPRCIYVADPDGHRIQILAAGG